jgi:integrase
MCGLEWRDVDSAGQVIRLRPELSKNKRGRVLPLSGDLAEIIDRSKSARRLDCRFVFHHDGRQLRDFRGSWKAACRRAGFETLLVHDLRTAVRNLVRAGIPERVAWI